MLIITGIVVVVWVVSGFIAKHLERKDYNNGVCKHCGTKLKYLYKNSQGERSYGCDNCGYTVRCSYNVDK